MEAAEDTSLEPAIGWLVETILASPLIGGKPEAWIRQAGLAKDVERLRSEVERVELVVSAVKGRAIGNRPLAKSLSRIKELLYDADDAVDELDYWRLQQQLEGGTLHDPDETDGQRAPRIERSRENADVLSSSVDTLPPESWGHFYITEFDENRGPVKARCKYCHAVVGCTTDKGTSVLRKHLRSKGCKKKRGASDSSSAGDASANASLVSIGGDPSTRDMRWDEAEKPTYTWDKDNFSNRIQDIVHQLQDIRVDVEGVLKIHGPDSGATSNRYWISTSHPRLRTSSVVQRKVYGRGDEKKSIIEQIKKHKSCVDVTVLPIVGIGGVGKTALAQLVYNDPALESQFDHRIWISVSNNFDEMRLSREMLDFVSQRTHEGLCSFAKLQEVLKAHIKSKRVLLILDDVWDDMNDCQWNQLLAPFKSGDAKGNMILVTTRKPSVAKRRGTTEPITLDALRFDDFWILFKACAFDDEDYKVRDCLIHLVSQILEKLKGNPLAAETAGALLREHLTIDHWSNVLENEDWKSLQLSGGIMPALKLCYDRLPYHLQQCFLYCSIFPYNHPFLAEELVRIWISQGFVKCNNSSKRLDELGQCYLADLVNLGFFRQIKRGSPWGSQTCYVMYNLMHDFARVVSRTECATMDDGLRCNVMSPTVRHLSIVTLFRSRSEEFEEKLRNTVTTVRNLRTLVLFGQYDPFFFQCFQDVFRKAHNLRMLQMSATYADFHSFLCVLGNPTHLRYLNLTYPKHQDRLVGQGDLPQILNRFFHLQVLDVGSYSDASRDSLQMVHLKNCAEWRILPSLQSLPFLTKLKLSNLRKIREVSVPSLEELVLAEMPELERCSCTSLEGLHSSLRILEIRSCPALKVFDLFEKSHLFAKGHFFDFGQKSWLPCLRILTIIDCPHLLVPCPLPPSTTICKLHINGVSTLKMEGSSSEKLEISSSSPFGESTDETMRLDDKILAFHNLRELKYLEIWSCANLTSISFKVLCELPSLEGLRVAACKKLFSSAVLPEDTAFGVSSNLKSLSISSCGITGEWLSLMLECMSTLKELSLNYCPQFKQLGFDALTSSSSDGLLHIPSTLTSSLRRIYISGIPYLTFKGTKEGFARFTSLEELRVWGCPELLSSLVHNDVQGNRKWLLPQSLGQVVISNYCQETLSLCFLGNVSCLKKLEVLESPCLRSLQLHSCTSLEDLKIQTCKQLAAVEGLQCLVILRNLTVLNSPGLWSYLERLLGQGYELCPRLESLVIDDLSLLTMLFCNGHTCLQCLRFEELGVTRLTDEQERALLLLRSLQDLVFWECENLVQLPVGLHSLPSLKSLMIACCDDIPRLPKEGLPPSLESLVIYDCSDELRQQCSLLATGKLKVKISD